MIVENLRNPVQISAVGKPPGENMLILTKISVENYRSSGHIISASNSLIRNNRDRMKSDHPIRS
jgi:hypothetical protein